MGSSFSVIMATCMNSDRCRVIRFWLDLLIPALLLFSLFAPFWMKVGTETYFGLFGECQATKGLLCDTNSAGTNLENEPRLIAVLALLVLSILLHLLTLTLGNGRCLTSPKSVITGIALLILAGTLSFVAMILVVSLDFGGQTVTVSDDQNAPAFPVPYVSIYFGFLGGFLLAFLIIA